MWDTVVSNKTEWIIALALAGLAYGFALSGGRFAILLLSFAAALLIWVLIVAIQMRRWVVGRFNLLVVLILVTYLTFSFAINLNSYGTASSLQFAGLHLLGLTAFFFLLAWVCSNLEISALYERLAIALTPIVCIVLIISISSTEFKRLEPFGLQPNWWGELMVAYSLTLLAVHKRLIRWAGLLIAALVLFHVQSRSGMVGWTIVVLSEIALEWRHRSLKSRLLLTAIGVVVVMALVAVNVAHSLSAFVSDRVLLLNSPYRGLGTGLSGRITGWSDALAAFTQSPFFGRGLDSYGDVHNGFLQIMAEGGVCLTAIMVCLIVLAVRRAVVTRNRLQITTLLACASYMSVQPRMFNLDITSLLFWMSLLRWNNFFAGAQVASWGASSNRAHAGSFPSAWLRLRCTRWPQEF